MNTSQIEKDYNQEKYVKLGISILVDVIGLASFAIPGLGEGIDFVWAPVAALINYAMFRGFTGATGGAATLVEELLPGMDWIPSVTMTWALKYVIRDNKTFENYVEKKAKKLHILSKYAGEQPA